MQNSHAKSVQNKLRISEKNPLATNRSHKSRFSLHRIFHTFLLAAEKKAASSKRKKYNRRIRNGCQYHFLNGIKLRNLYIFHSPPSLPSLFHFILFLRIKLDKDSFFNVKNKFIEIFI